MSRAIGADAWLHKNPYNNKKGYGRKKHKKWEKTKEARIAKHREERAANGYSYQDWINFDSFIAGIVATAALEFADNGAGYFPIGGENMDENYRYGPEVYENYKATCGAIYFALTNYLDYDILTMSHEEEITRYEEAKEAMILFSENLGNWWD